MKTIRICLGCGLPVPADAPGGICPECLLKSDVPLESDGAEPTPTPLPGQPFGEYRIVRLLGHGGMGRVYEAEHASGGRRVALKVIGKALASDADRKRFLREGRLAAAVNHPNVVYIHGSEEVEGVPIIAMELVHGGTLKDRLKREGALSVRDAVESAIQIIDARNRFPSPLASLTRWRGRSAHARAPTISIGAPRLDQTPSVHQRSTSTISRKSRNLRFPSGK